MIRDLTLELAAVTGMGVSDVRKVMATAPSRYKVYTIPKKSGGSRIIAHPARELKVLQRAFLGMVLENLPVHQCATAYRSGYSLLDNAQPHAVNGPILKMDLTDFFPSIRGKDWITYCSDKAIFHNELDTYRSAGLLFKKGKYDDVLRLSIGAPTSPAVSNILMYSFDQALFEAAASEMVTYTRYADDLTFSASRTGYLTGIQSMVAKTIRAIHFPRLQINAEKTKLLTTKYRRDVTGLVLSNSGAVTLGQLRKRNLRAGIHNAYKGELSTKELRSLSGMIAFAESVEPDFVEKLRLRYGEDLFYRIKSALKV